MRKFYLINSSDEIINLNNNSNLAINPTGLGLEISNEFIKIGTEFKSVNANSILNTVSLTILFYNHESYIKFGTFIGKHIKSLPLKLYYTPVNTSNDYYAETYFKSITKTEKSANVYRCQLTLERCSDWLIDKEFIGTIEGDFDSNKSYDYHYDYYYSSSDISEISLTNNGEHESYLKLIINGKVSNPIIRLFDLDDTIIAAMQVMIITEEADTLIIDSNPKTQKVELIKGDLKINIFRNLNFNSEFQNFLILPAGKFNLRLDIGVANSNTDLIIVQFKEHYGMR